MALAGNSSVEHRNEVLSRATAMFARTSIDDIVDQAHMLILDAIITLRNQKHLDAAVLRSTELGVVAGDG